ncbi:MAG: ribonuclease H-like domain-containing protein [Nitrososphaerota archaeon]|jgi:predicted PolB exonuclease-like 3'-5' exonuclease|nr:ribonuclease H-like domain-containing protein [Nitrososphaerota archaeon]
MSIEWNDIYVDIETTGLDPFNSQLITIQVRTKVETKIWPVWLEAQDGEKSVIKKFISFTDAIDRYNSRLIGYNVLKFDLPFLIGRMINLGMLTHEIWTRIFHELNWFDLYQFLGDEFGKFRKWKTGLAGGSVTTTNEQIPELFKQGKYGTIIEYIRDEMEGYEIVHNAIKKEVFYSELQSLRKRILLT